MLEGQIAASTNFPFDKNEIIRLMNKILVLMCFCIFNAISTLAVP